MTTEKLQDAIGMLPGDLIMETDKLRCQTRKPLIHWRRWAVVAACLVLVLSCSLLLFRQGILPGTDSASEAPAEAPMEMQALNSNLDDHSAADAAPRAEAEEDSAIPDSHPLTLTIRWQEDAITAEAGNFTLREVLEDGAVAESIACGAHPLQANLEPAAVSEETVALDWAVAPDRVTVRCWSKDADITEEGYTISILGIRTMMPVFAEYQIYEITAVWDEECTASYAVYLNLETEE